MWSGILARLAGWRPDTFVRADLEIVLVTKNSARWLGIMIDAYRRRGLDPCILVDDSTTDGTENIAIGRGVRCVRVTARQPRVEAMVGLIEQHFGARWIFRIDDDEFPSAALLRWLARRIDRLDASAVAFPRRQLRLDGHGRCEAVRHPATDYGNALDFQWRLYRPGEVEYIDDIHTPGFVSRGKRLMAPKRAFLAHFSWIVHGEEERRRAMRDYDRQATGAGSQFKPMMVFEDVDPAEYEARRLAGREFDALAHRLSATVSV